MLVNAVRATTCGADGCQDALRRIQTAETIIDVRQSGMENKLGTYTPRTCSMQACISSVHGPESRGDNRGRKEVFERRTASIWIHMEPIWKAMSTTLLVNAVISGLGGK